MIVMYGFFGFYGGYSVKYRSAELLSSGVLYIMGVVRFRVHEEYSIV